MPSHKSMVFVSIHQLNRLLVAGELLATHVTNYADELDKSSGKDPLRTERNLTEIWHTEATTTKRILNEIPISQRIQG